MSLLTSWCKENIEYLHAKYKCGRMIAKQHIFEANNDLELAEYLVRAKAGVQIMDNSLHILPTFDYYLLNYDKSFATRYVYVCGDSMDCLEDGTHKLQPISEKFNPEISLYVDKSGILKVTGPLAEYYIAIAIDKSKADNFTEFNVADTDIILRLPIICTTLIYHILYYNGKTFRRNVFDTTAMSVPIRGKQKKIYPHTAYSTGDAWCKYLSSIRNENNGLPLEELDTVNYIPGGSTAVYDHCNTYIIPSASDNKLSEDTFTLKDLGIEDIAPIPNSTIEFNYIGSVQILRLCGYNEQFIIHKSTKSGDTTISTVGSSTTLKHTLERLLGKNVYACDSRNPEKINTELSDAAKDSINLILKNLDLGVLKVGDKEIDLKTYKPDGETVEIHTLDRITTLHHVAKCENVPAVDRAFLITMTNGTIMFISGAEIMLSSARIIE